MAEPKQSEKTSSDSSSDQEAQRSYMELQMIDQQLKAIHRQKQEIDSNIVTIRNIISSLDELKEVKKGSDILAPIANGIFVKAKIEDPDDLLVNIGSEVISARSIEEAKDLLKKQTEELADVSKALEDNISEIVAKAQDIEKKLKEMKD